jgi:hypothetical protein
MPGDTPSGARVTFDKHAVPTRPRHISTADELRMRVHDLQPHNRTGHGDLSIDGLHRAAGRSEGGTVAHAQRQLIRT